MHLYVDAKKIFERMHSYQYTPSGALEETSNLSINRLIGLPGQCNGITQHMGQINQLGVDESKVNRASLI